MEREYGLLRSQLKGYLFEKIVMELLRKNDFNQIDVFREPGERVRELREGFIEMKGRGCWHQIDCPCDYGRLVPFLYPIRLLGEVKFYKSPLAKKHMREFIGVIKDIQENYFVSDDVEWMRYAPRKMEIGVFFSANGFQEEAEKLAYVHGIKTISYENNYVIDRIKVLIEELERNYLSVACIEKNAWNDFWTEFNGAIRAGVTPAYRRRGDYWADGYEIVLDNIYHALLEVRTSFIATTAAGVFLHFVSVDDFPEAVFEGTDEGWCRVFYRRDDYGNRYFWMEIQGDETHRRFYFTPPQSLDEAAFYGGEIVLNEKERIFRVLNVNIVLGGIVRSLTLHMDEDWLNEARREVIRNGLGNRYL